ncbi:MAG TPA: asparagine synthase (glutamine-hydrolyzing) [Cyclobacteriaceae bacterium]
MCGIAGLIVKGGRVAEDEVLKMIDKLHHRGPDAQGFFINEAGSIALLHTRLSIIDLSTGANQPFHSHDQRYVIVFNGEIYNFNQLRNELSSKYSIKFQTHSDTEVIIEAFSIWKEEMVNKLEGMFAIAILDKYENKLYLFRDRVGKKPLFYFKSENLFAFASEIKSLLELSSIKRQVVLNREAISYFLHLGYIPEPFTIYEQLFKFPSGQFGQIDLNLDFQTKPYWMAGDRMSVEEKITSPERGKKDLKRLINNAVEYRLVSDVPVGAFLSGGTDSSLVSAIASKYASSPLKTFSIGFEEDRFNESKQARKTAEYLKTDHTEYILKEHEAIGILDSYVKHFDEPFADTSAIPTMLVSKLARHEVKVVLTGDGGDELFQGYGSYVWAKRLDNPFIKILKNPIRKILNVLGNDRLERAAHLFDKVRTGGERSHIFSQEQYLFSQDEIKDQLLKDKSKFFPFEYCDPSPNMDLTPGERQAFFDLRYYLKDDLLVKVDRASMYYALECRCPLLDHRVIELAFSMDYSLKVRNGESKWILKELLREYLPAEFVNRPKKGFSVPLSAWLRNDLRYMIDSYLSEEVTSEIGLFNWEYIEKMKKDFFSGKDYLYNRLWAILLIHKWMKENG